MESSMDIPTFAAKLALTDTKVLARLVRQADIESANALDRLPHPSHGRFHVAFVNGAWVHQDRRYWYNSAGPFPTKKAAVAALGSTS
jgi:hypothetical protein